MPVVFADPQHSGNAGVTQGRGRAGFLQKTEAGLRTELWRLSIHGVAPENLDRHIALQLGVPGAIDDAHSPFADTLFDAVGERGGKLLREARTRHHRGSCHLGSSA
ncbi:MAG TPA: hypothetical protein VNA69_22810 [Thermoanaerobaculia bacterium]|nr:hypothetical protein [Thermoanaerobaculia bacterium]